MDGCFRLLFHSVVLLLCHSTAIQAALNYSSLGQLWDGELNPYQSKSVIKPNDAPGKLNFDTCCFVAVNESLQIHKGTLQYSPGQQTLRGDLNVLIDSPFPCTAIYNGSSGGLPQVWMTYNWCLSNCGSSWALEAGSAINVQDWVQPMVSYIVPSITFCLNISRRRRMSLPRRLFSKRASLWKKLGRAAYQIPIASLIVTVDLIIWLIMVLCLSGPMILAGIFEAVIDERLIKFLLSDGGRHRTTPRQRAHILLCVLLGNLDIQPAWDHSIKQVTCLEHDTHYPKAERPNDNSSAVEHSLSLADTGDKQKCQATPLEKNNGASSVATRSPTLHSNAGYQDTENIKSQLRSILGSQPKFGVTVGGAVIFYTGSFVYAIFENRATLGHSGTAHGLAFGVFWMTIPHVAIINSLLIAGDNTKVWEAANEASAQSNIEDEDVRTMPQIYRHKSHGTLHKLCYWQAWLWDRGSNKALWIQHIMQEYPELTDLWSALGISWGTWLLGILAPTLFLVLVPCLLGATISITTPMVGLSCRSMPTLIYGCSQVMLIFLWMFDWFLWKSKQSNGLRRTFISPPSRAWTIVRWIWFSLFMLGISTSFFTGIMGTVFVLFGLYLNCLCQLPIQYWMNRDHRNAIFYLGGNSYEQVHNAEYYWEPCGLAASMMLVLMTYVGWWYQEVLTRRVLDTISQIDEATLKGDQDAVSLANMSSESNTSSRELEANANATEVKPHINDQVPRLSNERSNRSQSSGSIHLASI